MLNAVPNFNNIDFKGGNLSSDGGAVLLLHFLQKMNVEEKFNKIPFDDRRFMPLYSNSDILSQLVTRTLFGYFNQSDQDIYIEDPLFSLYFEIIGRIGRIKKGIATTAIILGIRYCLGCDKIVEEWFQSLDKRQQIVDQKMTQKVS